MQFLHDQLDPVQIEKHDKMPMIEISLDLYGSGVMFTPNIGEDTQGKAEDTLSDLRKKESPSTTAL